MSSSSAAVRAAPRWRSAWRPRASASCCSSAATTCRAPAPTGTRRRCSSMPPIRRDETLVRTRRTQFSPRPALLRRRQFQGLWRGVAAPARTRLRRAAPCTMASRRRGRSSMRDFEPYYAEAERLFHVHGQRGEDPNEPPASGTVPLSAGLARAGASRRSATPASAGPAPVSSAAGHSAGREGWQADADQHLHPLRCLRRLSLSAQRQGRRAGDVRRSGAQGAPESDAADEAYVSRLRDRRRRPRGQRPCT